MTSRVLSLLCATSVVALTAACSSGPAAPTAPTSMESPTASAPVSVGVTVEGTVGLGNGTSAQADGVRALANVGGARVSVVGQVASTMTDASGRFTLVNVAPGRTELRFEAPGVDARLDVGDLTRGQTVSLDVQVLAQTATPVRDDDKGTAEVSLRGRIESMAGAKLRLAVARSPLTDRRACSTAGMRRRRSAC